MSGAPIPQNEEGTGAFRRSQASLPGRSADSFDLANYHRDRIRDLEQDNAFLRAHRQHLEQLLAVLLLLASRTANCDWRLVLDTCYTLADT